MTLREFGANRSDTYELFAALIDGPADRSLLVRAQGHALLQGMLSGIDPDCEESLDLLAAQHYSLFDRGVFPWAGVYLHDDARAGGVVGEAVVATLTAMGLEPGPDVETADHLPVLLRGLAALCRRESAALTRGDSGSASSSRGSQRELLDRYLLSWLTVFASSVTSVGDPPYVGVVAELLALCTQHRLSLDEMPVAAVGAPFVLPELPLDLAADQTSVTRIARWLCTPAASGWFLSLATIQELARSVAVPHGFGSRHQVLADTLRAASRFDVLAPLVAGLQEQLDLRMLALESAPYGQPELAHLVAPWSQRLAATRSLLDELLERAEKSNGRPPSGPRGGTALLLVLFTLLVGCRPWIEPGEELVYERRADRTHQDASGDFICRQPCDLFQLAWAGDSMLGDHGKSMLGRQGLDYPLRKVKVLLEDAYAIGNAEAAITTHRKKFDKRQIWHYGTKPAVAGVFAEAGFDAMGLANNHALDRGPIGLKDTLRHLHEAGVKTVGAGMDRDQAEAPLLIETPYGTVGVVAMFRTSAVGQESGPGRPGTVWLNQPTLRRTYQRARAEGARRADSLRSSVMTAGFARGWSRRRARCRR